ncbi:hypothetical protein COBT_001294, partial [Conglomerata obtusa]
MHGTKNALRKSRNFLKRTKLKPILLLFGGLLAGYIIYTLYLFYGCVSNRSYYLNKLLFNYEKPENLFLECGIKKAKIPYDFSIKNFSCTINIFDTDFFSIESSEMHFKKGDNVLLSNQFDIKYNKKFKYTKLKNFRALKSMKAIFKAKFKFKILGIGITIPIHKTIIKKSEGGEPIIHLCRHKIEDKSDSMLVKSSLKLKLRNVLIEIPSFYFQIKVNKKEVASVYFCVRSKNNYSKLYVITYIDDQGLSLISESLPTLFDDKIIDVSFSNFRFDNLKDSATKYLCATLENLLKGFEIHKNKPEKKIINFTKDFAGAHLHFNGISNGVLIGNVKIHKTIIDNFIPFSLILEKINLPKIVILVSNLTKNNEEYALIDLEGYGNKDYLICTYKINIVDISSFIEKVIAPKTGSYCKLKFIGDNYITKICQHIHFLWNYREVFGFTAQNHLLQDTLKIKQEKIDEYNSFYLNTTIIDHKEYFDAKTIFTLQEIHEKDEHFIFSWNRFNLTLKNKAFKAMIVFKPGEMYIMRNLFHISDAFKGSNPIKFYVRFVKTHDMWREEFEIVSNDKMQQVKTIFDICIENYDSHDECLIVLDESVFDDEIDNADSDNNCIKKDVYAKNNLNTKNNVYKYNNYNDKELPAIASETPQEETNSFHVNNVSETFSQLSDIDDFYNYHNKIKNKESLNEIKLNIDELKNKEKSINKENVINNKFIHFKLRVDCKVEKTKKKPTLNRILNKIDMKVGTITSPKKFTINISSHPIAAKNKYYCVNFVVNTPALVLNIKGDTQGNHETFAHISVTPLRTKVSKSVDTLHSIKIKNRICKSVDLAIVMEWRKFKIYEQITFIPDGNTKYFSYFVNSFLGNFFFRRPTTTSINLERRKFTVIESFTNENLLLDLKAVYNQSLNGTINIKLPKSSLTNKKYYTSNFSWPKLVFYIHSTDKDGVVSKSIITIHKGALGLRLEAENNIYYQQVEHFSIDFNISPQIYEMVKVGVFCETTNASDVYEISRDDIIEWVKNLIGGNLKNSNVQSNDQLDDNQVNNDTNNAKNAVDILSSDTNKEKSITEISKNFNIDFVEFLFSLNFPDEVKIISICIGEILQRLNLVAYPCKCKLKAELNINLDKELVYLPFKNINSSITLNNTLSILYPQDSNKKNILKVPETMCKFKLDCKLKQKEDYTKLNNLFFSKCYKYTADIITSLANYAISQEKIFNAVINKYAERVKDKDGINLLLKLYLPFDIFFNEKYFNIECKINGRNLMCFSSNTYKMEDNKKVFFLKIVNTSHVNETYEPLSIIIKDADGNLFIRNGFILRDMFYSLFYSLFKRIGAVAIKSAGAYVSNVKGFISNLFSKIVNYLMPVKTANFI